MLFYTSSTARLAKKIKIKKGGFVIKRFTDGEIYVRVLERVKNKKVWVLASTQAPADNLMELFLLLDALKGEGAKINILFTYFGYARQDRVKERGEALSAKVVCSILRGYKPEKILILHAHSPRLKKFLRFKDVVPVELYSPIIKTADVVVATDEGSLPLARKMGRAGGLPVAYARKHRPRQEKAVITSIVGDVKGKRAVIVDDMITTGGTVLETSKALRRAGAQRVDVIATHGIFSGDAIRRLEKSNVKKIWVTNSLRQERRSRKIVVLDLAKIVERIIRARS